MRPATHAVRHPQGVTLHAVLGFPGVAKLLDNGENQSMTKHWVIEPCWSDRQTAAERWGVQPLVAQLLHARGLELDDDANAFFSPQLTSLHPPALLPGATDAATRIVEAVRAGTKILLYGDYDVDGIMGIAILWHVLTQAGANVSFYVPHRVEQGYGLNADALRTAVTDGVGMIVSIDCGISDADVVSQVKALGAAVIITDHHTPPSELPDADVIVHPSVGGDYPNPHLCGAGVAFKLAWAIAQRLSGAERVTPEYRRLLKTMLPLAALATIADVVPLVGENRVITKCGLADAPVTPLIGLRALIDLAGLRGSKIDGHDVGFKIAPRINAAGRMGHARLAVELMTLPSVESFGGAAQRQSDGAALMQKAQDRAVEIAKYLEQQNRARRTIESRYTAEAIEMIQTQGMASDAKRAIVVASEEWHPGVIGIVASRLVDRFCRPAVVISTRDGRGQGSGRSVAALDLGKVLTECRSHLISFGGHPMAGGLRIKPDAVDDFREAFIKVVNHRMTHANLTPTLRIDAEVDIADLTMELVNQIGAVGPFGAGNPRPCFATGWLELADEPRCVGKVRVGPDGKSSSPHLQAKFACGGRTIQAIGFGLGTHLQTLKDRRRCQVAFEPIINHYNGKSTVQMQMVDLRFPE